MIYGALVALNRIILLVVLCNLFKETVLATISFHRVQMRDERLIPPITAIVFHFNFDFIYADYDILHVTLNFGISLNFVYIVSTTFSSFRKRMIFDVLFQLFLFA